jgi:hypothetical protein
VKELIKVANIHLDHVTIRSELRYSIGDKLVMLKYLDFGCKTGPIAMVQDCMCQGMLQLFSSGSDPDPELTR